MYTNGEAQTTGDVAGVLKFSLLGFVLGCVMAVAVDWLLHQCRECLQASHIFSSLAAGEGKQSFTQLQQPQPLPFTPEVGQGEEEEEWSTEAEEEAEEEDEGTSDYDSELECIEELQLKMVLVIRRDVRDMTTNDICALSAGAAVNLVQKIQRDGEHKEWKVWYEWWRRVGCAKITLKSPDYCTLRQVALAAEARGLPWHDTFAMPSSLVKKDNDEQMGVVVAVGPAPSAILNPITGKLKLLS
ncbi:peptidyl-tRNA hydrolase, PTH2 family [Trypanosoma rangeli]|uniref:peptidyl-tRNA hydrolase n=1 Tax=Trypanosoma rangeli TaxID=5698 RepID=A0A422NW74_TRYRA|nr:peptidyl-tRNA hydrolase, PTH2 family [Trypanosoma rangeli]RNF09737.1 peptidyl-tRNA hydrolase, PTH2 family [Trypanosoma rangeli]|eukprot:RNF09737.1 peptidyl-tRNA hydrolase, PTH2 family [Trypanosoma rangeli]